MHPSLFMSALLAHPDRPLSVCWEQHCKLLPGVAGISASTVAKWTIDEVRGAGPSLFLRLCFALTTPWREGLGKAPVRQSPTLLLARPPAHPSGPLSLPAAQQGLSEGLVGSSWWMESRICRWSPWKPSR